MLFLPDAMTIVSKWTGINIPSVSSCSRLLVTSRLLAFLPCLSGCAISYFDPETGVEHLYGFGHLAYRVDVPSEELVAVATQIETIGLGAVAGQEEGWFLLGIGNQTRLRILEESTCVKLEWPNDALINVRVGSSTPEFEEGTTIGCPLEGTPQ